MDIYSLYRNFWDFAFENPEKIKPNHIAIYSFAIEHCNRLGWKRKYGFPTSMAMDAVGIKNYRTYINALNDLVNFGFIEMIEKSKNQYSSNIIALVNFTKATTKALDKASIKHSTKQSQSIGESIVSINKQIYKETSLPINNINDSVFSIENCKEKYLADERLLKAVSDNPQNKITIEEIPNRIVEFNKHLLENGEATKKYKDYCSHFKNWHKANKKATTPQKRRFL